MVDEFESVQLVLFTFAPPALDALQFWNMAFGKSPTGFQTHAPGHTQAQGDFGSLNLSVIVQANRVDLLLQGVALPPPAIPPAAIPDIDDAIAFGMDTAKQMAGHMIIGRTAAVIQANNNAASLIEAAQKVAPLIPGISVPAESTSLSFEINVPRQSKIVQHRRISRLCKWHTVHTQMFNMTLGQAQVAQRFAAHIYADVYGEAMESLDLDGAIAALDEVTAEAKRIATEGFNALN